jgi:hypothetical protein
MTLIAAIGLRNECWECRMFHGARSRLARIIEMGSTALLVDTGYWILVADGVEGGVPEVKGALIGQRSNRCGQRRGWEAVAPQLELSRFRACRWDGVSFGCWGGSR